MLSQLALVRAVVGGVVGRGAGVVGTAVTGAGAAVPGTVWAGAVWTVETDGVEPPPEDPEPEEVGAVLRVAVLPGTAVAGIDSFGVAPGVVGIDGVPVGAIGAPVVSTVPPVEVTFNATWVEFCTGALKAKVAMMAKVAARLRPPAIALDAGATGPFLAFA